MVSKLTQMLSPLLPLSYTSLLSHISPSFNAVDQPYLHPHTIALPLCDTHNNCVRRHFHLSLFPLTDKKHLYLMFLRQFFYLVQNMKWGLQIIILLFLYAFHTIVTANSNIYSSCNSNRHNLKDEYYLKELYLYIFFSLLVQNLLTQCHSSAWSHKAP